MKTTNLTTYNLLGMFPKGVVLNKKAGYKKSTISIRLEPLQPIIYYYMEKQN